MASTSVNRPTDVRQKEQDVNQKLQLYGIYYAFANGKVPSNKQIDIALNSALASKTLSSPSSKLSQEGQKLVADLRDVIEKAKVLLLTKNEGNLIQDFIWRAQHIDGGNTGLPNAPVDQGTAQQHGNQALDGLRTLGTLILSNGQFRKLLSDATLLIRDMAGDVAQKAANKINPSEEQLSQIDQPAEDNTWHDVPDLSRDNLKAQAKQQYDKNIGLGKGDVKAAAGDATQVAHPTGSRDPADAANVAARDQHHGTSSGMDAQFGAKQGADRLLDRSNVSDEDRDRVKNNANATKEDAKRFFKEKLPQERRDRAIHRLKKMVVEIQGHEDYQQAIDTLLYLAETYTGHSKTIINQSHGTVKDAHTGDSNLRSAELDLRTLLERFANFTSADDLFDAFNKIYADADRDPELKNWFKHLDQYVRACLKEQGYILTDRATDEYNQIYDQGEFLLRERYRDHVDRVFDEFKFLADQFDSDPHNKAFGNAMQKLFLDLGNDDNGKATFKPHLLKDLTDVIIPGFFEGVRYVPIPRIEYSDPTIDAIVENLVVESDNLFPNSLEVQSDNWFRWGRKQVVSRNKNKVMVAVSGVQMDLKDVSYYIKKKQGFPSIMDKGVMDIFMGGEGFSFKLALETADQKDRTHFFKVNTVNVTIKNLKLKMKQSNHKLLFNFFKPLLMAVVKPALTKVIEKKIRDTINQADQYAYAIKTEADRALAEAQNDPESVPNIYQRYVSAAQRKMTEGKQKTKDVAANKQANVAMTQHDSIFRDIKLPGGISTKATEYKELAAKGDRWESPVFGIGSASESTNIPKASAVSRKPHRTAKGVLKDAEDGRFAHGSKTDVGYDTSGYGAANANSAYSASGMGYGNEGHGAGYGAAISYPTTTVGYTTTTVGYPTTTNGASTGFSNQVNQAFDNTQDLSLKNTTNGRHTTLGQANPVLQGLS